MSGSFWKFSNGFTSLSNISTLLENYSINQDQGEGLYAKSQEILLKLLDENDILQELLSNNPLLLEFLREDDILGMLVDFVIKEGEVEEKEETGEEKGEEKDEETKDPKEEEPKEPKELKNVDNEKVKSKDSDDEDNENQDDDNENQEKDDFDDDQIDSIDENDTNDEEDETVEEIATRRATIAAEILSADVWSLTDTVMESTPSLNKLWSILDSKSPMSINLSTYFMKIMEHLLDMKCDEMITYLIENQSNLVEKFMNHLSNPPLMDFLLKLISTDKPDNSTGIIDFLQNQDLITFLIEALDITEDTSAENYDLLLVKQSSAADFLKALITISANSTTDNSTIGPNELTRELVSYEQMNALCNIMLKGGYALANGVGIIIEIIRKNNSDYDILPVLYITLDSHPPTGRDPIYLGHLLKVFGTKIDSFNKLLVNNVDSSKLKTPFGEIEPLGFERFKICELVAELLHCSNMALLNDNKGFDVVKERDTLRMKMKEYDPISFKYNEVIVLPPPEKEEESTNQEDVEEEEEDAKSKPKSDDDDYFNDTIDSFNSKFHQDGDSLVHGQDNEDDEDEPHANANLTEEQIRANPVVGDFLKISLFDTQIISNILTMFFKFPWNNFLHNVVFDIVQQVLNGSMDIGFNKFLAIDLFHLGDITNKIIEGQKLCSGYEDSHNGLRLGFMGHLTLIAEEVVKFIQLYPTNTLSEMIDIKVEDEVWEDYVSHVLYDTREKYNAILGGGEDDDEDDDEEENNTFDEGLGEIIEEVKTGLVFDINTDHDIEGSGYEEKHSEDVEDVEEQDEEEEDVEEHDDEEDREDQQDVHKLHKDRLDSDESESDDDDHFTNYMSQQLTNTASTDIATGRTSPDIPEPEFSDADEYIDPNDDGMSYKKSNPLYDASGSLLKPPSDGELDGDLSSEDSSSNSDNDEDIEIDDELHEVDSSTNKLTRAASKG